MPKFYVVAGQYHNNGICQGKKKSFGKFFNFERTSFHGEGIHNYYSQSLII